MPPPPMTEEEKALATRLGYTDEQWMAQAPEDRAALLAYYRSKAGETSPASAFAEDIYQRYLKRYGAAIATAMRREVTAQIVSGNTSNDDQRTRIAQLRANPAVEQAIFQDVWESQVSREAKAFESYYQATFLDPIKLRIPLESARRQADDRMLVAELQRLMPSYKAEYLDLFARMVAGDDRGGATVEDASGAGPGIYFGGVARQIVKDLNPDMPPESPYVEDVTAIVTSAAMQTAVAAESKRRQRAELQKEIDGAATLLEGAIRNTSMDPQFVARLNAIRNDLLKDTEIGDRFLATNGAMTPGQFLAAEMTPVFQRASVGTPYLKALAYDQLGRVDLAQSMNEIRWTQDVEDLRAAFEGKVAPDVIDAITTRVAGNTKLARTLLSQAATTAATATTLKADEDAFRIRHSEAEMGLAKGAVIPSADEILKIAGGDPVLAVQVLNKRVAAANAGARAEQEHAIAAEKAQAGVMKREADIAAFQMRAPVQLADSLRSNRSVAFLKDKEALRQVYALALATGESPEVVLERHLRPFEEEAAKGLQVAGLQMQGAIPFAGEKEQDAVKRREEAQRVAALPGEVSQPQAQAASALGIQPGQISPGGVIDTDLVSWVTNTPGYRSLAPQEQQKVLADVTKFQTGLPPETARRIDLQLPELERIVGEASTGRAAAETVQKQAERAAGTVALPQSVTGGLDPGAQEAFRQQVAGAIRNGPEAVAALAGGEAALGKSGVDALKRNLAEAQEKAQTEIPGAAPPPEPVKSEAEPRKQKPARPTRRVV